MAKSSNLTQYQNMSKRRLHTSEFVIFLIVPIVVILGYLFLGEKMYMPVSFLILISIMIPFFMVFEKRKTKAREMMLIIMMSALTVVSHLAFHIIFPIQIGTALVILSGISLGAEAGFLIGALSRLICNFYMGQGPWTPWQMFAWGILGFLFGMIFNKDTIKQGDCPYGQPGEDKSIRKFNFTSIAMPLISTIFALLVGYISFILFPNGESTYFGLRFYIFGAIGLAVGFIFQRKKLSEDAITLALMTFFFTIIIYGGLMNISTVINSTNAAGVADMSLKGIQALYISGLPFDIWHGLTASICVFIMSEGFITKMDRIKIKYGIYR